MVLHHPSLSHKNCPGLALSRFLINQDIVLYWGYIYIIIRRRRIMNINILIMIIIYIYIHVYSKWRTRWVSISLCIEPPKKDRNIIYHNFGRMLLPIFVGTCYRLEHGHPCLPGKSPHQDLVCNNERQRRPAPLEKRILSSRDLWH